MQRFLYDIVYEAQGVVEINELFAEDTESALLFFDRLFLELHSDVAHQASEIRLRTRGEEREITRYALHWDAVA
jgi:hypothetical protein